jgi:hypothetical protein
MNYTKTYTGRLAGGVLVLPVRTAIAAALIVAWCATTAPTLRAATMSYNFTISSDLSLMMNPQNSSIENQVAQKSSNVVKTANNNPVIEITNTSTTADISEVKLSLTDPDSVFNALKLLQSPLGATPAAPFTNKIWGGPSTMVDIVLPHALLPNQSLVFAVNLGPLGGFPDISWVPGFENILFQTPVTPNTNANLAVTFNDPSNPNNPTVLTNVLPSLTAMVPLVTVTSACCSTAPTSVFMTSFGGPPAVPEPSGMLLIVLGSLPLAVPAWRKYKRGAQSKKS